MIQRQCYEEIQQVFDHFSKYHMKFLLGDFNAKVKREDIFSRLFGMRLVIRIIMVMVLEQ